MSKYSATYRIRVSDVDSLARVKLSSFLSILQEAATEHAELLGVGRRRLLSKNLGWALSKLNLSFTRMPRWGERITIVTWPSYRTRISTDREFVVLDARNAVVATARTLWVLFNLKERRIEKLSALGEFEAIAESADATVFDKPPFPQEGDAAPLFSNFGVRKDDIDLNGHVNNAVYVAWALEPLSMEFCLSHEPERIALWYLSEVKAGDRLDVECRTLGDETFHRIASGALEHARAAVKWRPSALPPDEVS